MIVFCQHCETAMDVASRNFKTCPPCKKALARERNKRYSTTTKRAEAHARYEKKRLAIAREENVIAKREGNLKKFLPYVPESVDFPNMSTELQDLILAQVKDDRYGHKYQGSHKVSLDSLVGVL